ncbi:MAG: glycosyltransferase family 4 protein [Elusimicrobia bacterium]|nr:glycosyltransferase family 4 protein [Elusimicrobiota bacterium]
MDPPSEALTFCLPLEPPERGGGGFRFLRNLEAYLDRRSIPWTRSVASRARVLFVNAWHTPWTTVAAAALLRPDVTVVHRVDGAAADYGRDPAADRAQSRVDRLTDLTIFQSSYCRHSTREKFPVIRTDGPVIHNPVDVEVFRPDGKRAPLPAFGGPRVCAVTWSTNPRKGAGAVYALAQALPEIQFVLCGRFEDPPTTANVVVRGILDAPELAATLRSCDVLVTFAENEACPNVVLEALASGLPVLYRDSGATAELVADCGYPVTLDDLPDRLRMAMSRKAELGARARQHAITSFAPDLVFRRYLDEIRRALRPPTSRVRRTAEVLRRSLR